MPRIETSIETDGNPLSADSSEFSDNYDERGAPVPDDPEEWQRWGQQTLGKDWDADITARRRAAQIARDEEKERERIEKEKVDVIRELYDTDRREYNRRMKAHNLEMQRRAAQAEDKSNPVKAVVQGNWEAFLEATTTDKQTDARAESMELSQSRSHPQKPRRARIVKSTARDQKFGSSNRSKRPASTLAEALVDEEREQRKVPATKRASRRIAHEPVQHGMFAEPSRSTRKRNSTAPRNHASPKKSTLVEAAKPQGWAHRLRPRKQKQPGG
jgi:hypothetical protein